MKLHLEAMNFVNEDLEIHINSSSGIAVMPMLYIRIQLSFHLLHYYPQLVSPSGQQPPMLDSIGRK